MVDTIKRTKDMKLQDYLDGLKIAYDAFMERGSTFGAIDESTFRMGGRVDYGDIAYTVFIKSFDGFDLEYSCPITDDGGLKLGEESIWNETLEMWWGSDVTILDGRADVFKAMKKYLEDGCDTMFFRDGDKLVKVLVDHIDPFNDSFLPEVFRKHPVDTWNEVDGMKHCEYMYTDYFVVNGKKYGIYTREL